MTSLGTSSGDTITTSSGDTITNPEKLQRPEIRLETRRFLGRRPEFLAVCRVVEKLSMLSPELATLPGSFAPPESENGHPEPPIYPERMCVAKAFRRELAVTPLIRPRRRAAESAPWPCYGTARR